MLILYHPYNIIIDHVVGQPGSGRDVFNGLNAVDKNFISVKMPKNKLPILRSFSIRWELTPQPIQNMEF